MSNKSVMEYTASAVVLKCTQKSLIELDADFPGTLTPEPKVPDLLEAAVEIIVNKGTIEELTCALDVAIRRILAGAGAKAIATGDFDPTTIAQICEARASVMDLPMADTPDTVVYLDHPLRTTLHREAERFARMVSEVREANNAARARFSQEREEVLNSLAELHTNVDLAASRLARNVLLKKGVGIFDVILAEAKAQSWEIFVNALIAECRWIIVGKNAKEKEVALEVVRSLDESAVTSCAFGAKVSVHRAHYKCIQTLGYAS